MQGQVLLGVSSIKKYPSSGLSGRNQVPNRAPSGIETGELAKEASLVSLVGRKVQTRWPDDNNFYEAVISDYNRADVLTFPQLTKILFQVVYSRDAYVYF